MSILNALGEPALFSAVEGGVGTLLDLHTDPLSRACCVTQDSGSREEPGPCCGNPAIRRCVPNSRDWEVWRLCLMMMGWKASRANNNKGCFLPHTPSFSLLSSPAPNHCCSCPLLLISFYNSPQMPQRRLTVNRLLRPPRLIGGGRFVGWSLSSLGYVAVTSLELTM